MVNSNEVQIKDLETQIRESIGETATRLDWIYEKTFYEDGVERELSHLADIVKELRFLYHSVVVEMHWGRENEQFDKHEAEYSERLETLFDKMDAE